VFLMLALAAAMQSRPAAAETHVKTYFENTDHELTVYFITGKEPGNTMMIIGGIQGDEPGGYIAADLYADMLLEKGNLIVIPRANFYSIRKNKRGVNGDMNRKFSPKAPKHGDYDDRIVEILKQLMSRSDVLLNLHEGSGFYYPEYVSLMRNPMKYGQSIIIDALTYTHTDGKTIDLEGPALRVIKEINRNIKNPDHLFHLNNHDTFSENSRHKEQRGSATFNALTLFGIPGYGIETSKSIRSIETKVKYETLAINAFMREYGIVPEHPSIYLPKPELDHLVVTIVGNPNPFAVKNGASLSVPRGSAIKVTSVVANYKRGISIDIIGHGNTNDLNREAVILAPTAIKVYKDAYQCGNIRIDILNTKDRIVSPHVHIVSLDQIKIRVGNKNYVVSSGDTLHIVKGDLIRIIEAWTTDPTDSDFRINFRGFVGNKSFNDAEDRGYDIDTAKDLIERYSIGENGDLFRIEAIKGRDSIGSVYVRLEEPSIRYLIVEGNDTRHALAPGEVFTCRRAETVKILSIISNVTARPFIDAYISDGNGGVKTLRLPVEIKIPSDRTIYFRRTSENLGSISFRVTGKT